MRLRIVRDAVVRDPARRINAANGCKIFASVVFLAVIWGATKLVQAVIRAVAPAIRTRRFGRAMNGAGLEPRVYWCITDNWVEMALRYVVEIEHRRGEGPDERCILEEFDKAMSVRVEAG